MTFDFDTRIDRRNTNSSKWDEMEAVFGSSPDTHIAMWVASMDFASPPAVNATLHKMAEHGVHGYFGDPRAYTRSIINWMETRHGWSVDPDWIATTHGVVAGVSRCLNAFTKQRDGVIIFSPVYHQFANIITANNRKVVESELTLRDGVYHMDLEALEAQLTGKEKMVIFCSPHNPAGRIWSVEEQCQLAEFCAKHDLILISDEIHHDLIMPGQSHTVMPLAAPEHMDRIVMLTAASKTFNIAGGLTGNAIIPDSALRAKFATANKAAGASVNRVGAMMCTAAYAHGAPWLDALLPYLDQNRQIFTDRINALPGMTAMPMASTYLGWVDFSGTGMAPPEFTDRVVKSARVQPSYGSTFGMGGENFLRFNFAMPRSLLEEALGRIERAFGDLQ